MNTTQTASTHHSRLAAVLFAAVMTCALVPTMSAQTTAQAPAAAPKPAPSPAKLAFEKLKTMSGSWHGTIMNIPIDVTVRLASSNTALLHEATTSADGPPQHEITMFYVEDDRLLAMHYCDGGNRVRWEGKLSADGSAIAFTMLDVSGSTRGGLLKAMTFQLPDANKHTMVATFVRPDGNPIELRGDFQRK